MEKILVIAGNKKQFDYFMEGVYPKDKFVYFDGVRSMYGIKYSGYIKYGTYDDRKDWYEISDLLDRYFYKK